MITERTYMAADLHHGVCECCGHELDEITDSGVCVDCIEEELFIEECEHIEPIWY